MKGPMAATTAKNAGSSANGRRPQRSLPRGFDALQEYKKQLTSGTTLLGRIQTHVQREQESRNADRRPDVLHPSEMCKSSWCPRQSWYVLTGRGTLESGFKFWSLNTFEEGHEVHAKYQRWLWEMGILEGEFYCPVCHLTWWDKAPQRCTSCGLAAQYLVYKEVPIYSERYRIGGHGDGQIEGKLLEIKTVGLGSVRKEAPGLYKRYQDGELDIQTLWGAIKRPFPTHIKQATIYAIIRELREIVFLYEYKPTQAVKEFTVKVQAATIEPILANAEAVVRGIKSDLPPMRPSHATSPEAAVCAACPFRDDCWGLSVQPRRRGVRLRPASSNGHGGPGQARRQATHAA